MGEIPVLEVDGERLTQTAPILLQLAERYRPLRRYSRAEKFELLRWLFWDNHKLTGYMATYRYYRAFTPRPDLHLLAHFRRRLDDFLSIVERHMDGSAFAVGDKPTIADLSTSAYPWRFRRRDRFRSGRGEPPRDSVVGRIAALQALAPGLRSPARQTADVLSAAGIDQR